MTQNEVDIIKNAVLDATEAYVDARLNVAPFVKTQIGTTVGNPTLSNKKWYHTVRCNQTSGGSTSIEYKNVLSVGNTKFEPDSVVFILAPNAQFSNQFILGKLDNTPVNITGGSIMIGGDPYSTPPTPNFYVDSNGNVSIKYGSININEKFKVSTQGAITSTSGSIGGFEITSQSLGTPLGSEGCGMSNGGTSYGVNVYAYHSSHNCRMYQGKITVSTGANGNLGVFVYSGSDESGSYIQTYFANVYSSSRDDTVAWLNDISDKKLKTDIKEISTSSVRNFFSTIKPSQFKYTDKAREEANELKDNYYYGIIAQELQESLKQANLPSESIINERERDGILKVNYKELHGLELAGIKDLYSIIKDQQKQINTLKAEIEAK